MKPKVTPEELVEDAEDLFRRAVKEMEVDLRNAAEKAWCATMRAIDALVLAKTGKKPRYAHDRRESLETLLLKEPKAEKLKIGDRYSTRSDYLHAMCFYEGVCKPPDAVKRRIIETKDLIEDVKELIKERSEKMTRG